MNREFLDLYNQELTYLREQGSAFAEAYPAVAERLGGLLEDRSDPMLSGLLEGTAFLAARVQLKMKHEFAEFTSNLFEQLYPSALAPIPSMVLARVTPKYGDSNLRNGIKIARHAPMEAVFRERQGEVRCRFTLSAPITLTPLELTSAKYLSSAAQVSGLGADMAEDRRVRAGLSLTLTHRMAEDPELEVSQDEARQKPEFQVAGCRIDTLPVYLTGPIDLAARVYEQIFGHTVALYIRTEDAYGQVTLQRLPIDSIEQVGFDEEDALLRNDRRLFVGFDYLRDYFNFPRSFLGFRLCGLRSALNRVRAKSFDLVFVFDDADPRLPAHVEKKIFALHTAPAVNLFERQTDRVPIKKGQHEFAVIPDRTRPLDYEVHSVTDVNAHFSGGDKLAVEPLYSVAPDADKAGHEWFYSVRRMPRRQSSSELRRMQPNPYIGTETYISISSGAQAAALLQSGDKKLAELSLKVMASNRALAADLPVGSNLETSALGDFRLLDDTGLKVDCVSGPTPPRPPLLSYNERLGEEGHVGAIVWRLVNILALNHSGLLNDGAGQDGRSFRDILSVFAPLADNSADRQAQSVRSVSTRPVVRRLQQKSGTGVARGLEVTITLDDKAFEGASAFLLGAVLDRFLCEYASINHFTQCVIATTERGTIMKWPPRIGAKGIL
ncbi:type VI secretion system baseplate subunit TssF [Roseibium denhamense]|uniref:Type VI secretion system protein ImpG n=1 Tax=Roseibium denhamense TaxID=76305 RepID=A0ABY1NQN9_9HYPH|nr:type VI secretion system baseplate subunit TssF [Roseibium denhamense]MTI08038.1 type VI secretion system baseplate subunit TssF [Roseibium denhamense]SMP15816.1 type VI secretion system protein ImpG [Roseibium denhamense]